MEGAQRLQPFVLCLFSTLEVARRFHSLSPGFGVVEVDLRLQYLW